MSATQLLTILSTATLNEVRPPTLLRVLAVLRSMTQTAREEMIQLKAIEIITRLIRIYCLTPLKVSASDEANSSDEFDLEETSDRHDLIQVAHGCFDILSHLLQSPESCTTFLKQGGETLIVEVLKQCTLEGMSEFGVVAAVFTCINMLLSQPTSATRISSNLALCQQLEQTVRVGCSASSDGAAEDKLLQYDLLQSGFTSILLLMQHQLELRESSPSSNPHTPLIDLLSSQPLLTSFTSVMNTNDAVLQIGLGWKYCTFIMRRCELVRPKSTSSSSTATSKQPKLTSEDPLNDSTQLQLVIDLILSFLNSSDAPSTLLTQALATLQSLCVAYEPYAARMLCEDSTSPPNDRPFGLKLLVQLLHSRPSDDECQLGVLRLLNTLLLQSSSALPTAASLSKSQPSPVATEPNGTISNLSSSLAASSISTTAAASSASTLTALASVATSTASSSSTHLRLLALDILPLLLIPFAISPASPPSETLIDRRCLSLYAFNALFMSGKWLGPSATALDVTRHSDEEDSTAITSAAITDEMLHTVSRLYDSLLQLQSSTGATSDLRPSGSLSVTPSSIIWSQSFSSTLYVLGGCRLVGEYLIEHRGVESAWECIQACKNHPPLIAPILVFLLRLGTVVRESIFKPVMERQLPIAVPICESLCDTFPDEIQLIELVSDTILMMQGKAAPPKKYRT